MRGAGGDGLSRLGGSARITSMVQATFDLPEDLLAALESLAAERRSTPSAIVFEALEVTLRTRRLSSEEWLRHLHELQESVHANGVAGSPEQIEADIDAATDEVWAERRATRRR